MEKQKDKDQGLVSESRPRVGRFSKADEEKMRAWVEKNLPPMSAAGMEQVIRAVRCLSQPTQAGAERRAIFALLMKHEGVQDTVLYRCCSKKFDVRVREMQKAGVQIARWAALLEISGLNRRAHKAFLASFPPQFFRAASNHPESRAYLGLRCETRDGACCCERTAAGPQKICVAWEFSLM